MSIISKTNKNSDPESLIRNPRSEISDQAYQVQNFRSQIIKSILQYTTAVNIICKTIHFFHDRTHSFTFLVWLIISYSDIRRNLVKNAIEWLILNNPLYKDCKYSKENMAIYEAYNGGPMRCFNHISQYVETQRAVLYLSCGYTQRMCFNIEIGTAPCQF